jgi:hypothetical protein
MTGYENKTKKYKKIFSFLETFSISPKRKLSKKIYKIEL